MPPTITGPDFEVLAQPGETVLDACRRAGVSLPFGCRAGACLKCLMHGQAERLPQMAPVTLGPDVAARGLFLPCRCVPDSDLRLRPPRPGELQDLWRIEVADIDDQGPRLSLRPLQASQILPGQCVTFQVDLALQLRGIVQTEPDDAPLIALRLDAPSAAAVQGRVRGLAHRLVAVRVCPASRGP